MKRLNRVLVPIILWGLLWIPGSAMARPRALLMVRDFHHWLDFSYEYDGRKTGGDRGQDLHLQEHRLEESYHFDTAYAVYHPRILVGRFGIDLGINEDYFSGSEEDSGSDYGTLLEYDLNGTFFDRRAYPLNFFSRREMSQVMRKYARNYDLDTDNYGLNLHWRNHYMPLRLGYHYTESQTDGLELDRRQQIDTFTFSGSHVYENISNTQFNLYHSEDETDYGAQATAEKNKTDEYNVSNNLTWGKYVRRSSFLSSYRYRDESGTSPVSSSNWRESLGWQLGKALRWSVDYENNRDKPLDLSRKEQTGRTWIEHQLYESLTTRLEYEQRTKDLDGSSEDYYNGGLSLAYAKLLPAESRLDAAYDYNYGETKRAGDADRRFIIDEHVTMEPAGINYLDFFNVVTDSPVVRSADRLIFYQEGADYTVSQVGSRTGLELTAGSLINPGDQVSVDYFYLVDPGITFSSTGHQASVSLSLFSRRYRFYGNFYSLDQKLLESDENLEGGLLLNDVTSWTIGAQSFRGYSQYGLEYVDYDAITDAWQSMEGYWRYSRYFSRQYIMVTLKDRLTSYDSTGVSADRGSEQENVITAGFSYRKRLPYRAIAGFSANYLNQRGRSNDRDSLDLSADYKLRFGLLELELEATQEWEWQNGRKEREDRLMLTFRRRL
jgi:hypothetical protein